MSANAALYYHVDAFDTSRPKLMGRHAAGEGFLRGFARHAEVDRIYCYTATKRGFADFERRMAALSGRKRECAWIPFAARPDIARTGCMFMPAPTLGNDAWQRRFGDQRGYSLCGLTHTTASHGVMSAIGELMVAPFQPWDAIICTSKVVRATFDHILETWGAYLESRTGSRPACPVQLPVIPLGVDCDAFAPSRAHEKARNEWRKRLGVKKNDVVVLFMGRISYHAKAHPLPMYLALEEAARRTGKRIHLVQAGWFGTDAIRDNFVRGAKAFCPSVRAVFLDGRKPDVRENVWFAADVFASLSDNIQETFGLTPVEAMAAGLPVVVTDWNGYRETVRDGVDGFTVPTAMPPPGAGEGFAYRHLMDIDNYDHYIGFVSQLAAVDVRAATEAFTRLVDDGALRRKMGEAGRKRAREAFDWKVVIGAYQALWAELAERRAREETMAPRPKGAPAHPLRDDPLAVYADYPTLTIGPECRVRAVDGADAAALRHIRSLPMNDLAAAFLIPADEVETLLTRIGEAGSATVGELLDLVPANRRVNMYRTVAWLAKMGLVGLEPPPGA